MARPCNRCGTLTDNHAGRLGVLCSDECRNARKREKHRAKNYRRRTARRTLDVTQDYERELRRKAKRCPMPGCGVKLIDDPFLPNSKELDHIVPVNPGVGGTHTIGNVRIICRQCNQRRPDDGSDYTGPVTLWAQEPGVALAQGCRGRGSRQAQPCERCGAKLRVGRCWTCEPSRKVKRGPEIGRRAAELRATGMPWHLVAEELGYANASAAYNAAVRDGEPHIVAAWRRRNAA